MCCSFNSPACPAATQTQGGAARVQLQGWRCCTPAQLRYLAKGGAGVCGIHCYECVIACLRVLRPCPDIQVCRLRQLLTLHRGCQLPAVGRAGRGAGLGGPAQAGQGTTQQGRVGRAMKGDSSAYWAEQRQPGSSMHSRRRQASPVADALAEEAVAASSTWVSPDAGLGGGVEHLVC
jgi:hypothetical protein